MAERRFRLRGVTLLAGALSLFPVLALAQAKADRKARADADLRIRSLVGDVWIHTSVTDLDGSPTPSNGLVIGSSEASLLVDTAWTPAQTQRILEWADAVLSRPIRVAVVTHSHSDRIGGLATLMEQRVMIHAHAGTARLARNSSLGWPPDASEFEESKRVRAGTHTIEAFYPGPGHAPDNVVVWIPEERVLFGGCLVKSAGAKGLGNTAAADLESWSTALASVREKYPGAAWVVPGHGEPGDLSLLDHTASLLRRASRK